jgi:hypothetical protein
LVAAGVLLFLLYDHTRQVKASLVEQKKGIHSMASGGGDKANDSLLTAVPAFVMPADLGKQRLLFESEVNRQLKQNGINAKLKFTGLGKSQAGLGVKLMKLQCKARCKFDQALTLLASLTENPYLVDIEEFTFKCDEAKPQQVDLTLVVSTFYEES